MSVYYGAQASVKAGSSLSESFDLGVGVLQGDTLAPYLFIIVLDWVLRNALPDESLGAELTPPAGTKSRPIPGKYLTDLDYADDIALLSNSIPNGQAMLLSIETWAAKVGLKINHSKTEYMLVGNWEAERSTCWNTHHTELWQRLKRSRRLQVPWLLATELDEGLPRP